MKQEGSPSSGVWPLLALVGLALLGIVYAALGSGRSALAYAIGVGILLAGFLVTVLAIGAVGWAITSSSRFLQQRIRKRPPD